MYCYFDGTFAVISHHVCILGVKLLFVHLLSLSLQAQALALSLRSEELAQMLT